MFKKISTILLGLLLINTLVGCKTNDFKTYKQYCNVCNSVGIKELKDCYFVTAFYDENNTYLYESKYLCWYHYNTATDSLKEHYKINDWGWNYCSNEAEEAFNCIIFNVSGRTTDYARYYENDEYKKLTKDIIDKYVQEKSNYLIAYKNFNNFEGYKERKDDIYYKMNCVLGIMDRNDEKIGFEYYYLPNNYKLINRNDLINNDFSNYLDTI